MARSVDRQTGAPLLAPAHTSSTWTVLIPAAGRGTRLGFDKPKILFPVGGITILDRLVRLFEPLCGKFVFVFSPDGAPVVEPELQRLLPGRSRIAIQNSPAGMADAVASGLPLVETENTAIVWGDQFALKTSSLEFCMRLLEGSAHPQAVCPTLLRPRPYIHFARDPQSGRILSVLQQREGDVLPEEGESDSGVFFFRTAGLRGSLAELLQGGQAIGAQTRELNFLPIFPLVDRTPDRLITANIMSESESVGINSPADAKYLEAVADL
jgi:bifunctional UDP-N-acetylglucosamine pyrophosphorylase/glucosamine-1-phosphate N-acetyltransferase